MTDNKELIAGLARVLESYELYSADREAIGEAIAALARAEADKAAAVRLLRGLRNCTSDYGCKDCGAGDEIACAGLFADIDTLLDGVAGAQGGGNG